MSCKPPNQPGVNGQCYAPCPNGQDPQGNGNTECIQKCPPGFMESEGGCIRPSLPRDKKPCLSCPQNSTRISEQCWVNCPTGTVAEFELCSPVCPDGFVTSNDGQTCEAEFIKRTVTPRSACFDGERRVENLCLSACPQGTTEYEIDATLCKQVLPANVKQQFNTVGFVSSKIKFGRQRTNAVCATGQTTAGNFCQSDCPLNSDADNEACLIRCPVGYNQQDKSCSRLIVARNVVQGSGNVVGQILKFVGGTLLILVVVVLLLSFFSRRRNSQ